MKKRVIFVAIVCVWSIFLCGGCITFSIIPSYPVEGYVENLSLCRGITEKAGGLLVPWEVEENFSADDNKIFCFLELKNIDRKIQLKWKWYAPDQALFRESENVTINSAESRLETLTAYDELNLHLNLEEEARLVGVWTVVVLLDNQLIARRLFEVK